jgi:ring-1,2-phenylacetyl-CoA epoxidase subunit PaaD
MMMTTKAATQMSGALDLSALEAAASAVPDPELPVVTLGDLGIVRGVEVTADGAVEVRLTPTFVGCPATEVIAADVRAAVEARLREGGGGADDTAGAGAAADVEVRTRMVMSPPWSTDWISDDGRRKLSEHGIAPPRGARRGGPVAVTIGRRSGVQGAADVGEPTGSACGDFGGAAAGGAAGLVDGNAQRARGKAAAVVGGEPTGSARADTGGGAVAGGVVAREGAGAAAVRFSPSSPSPSPLPPTRSQAQVQPCPQCGSADTRELSAFGSTPCQSLRACRACGEPFGAMKSL